MATAKDIESSVPANTFAFHIR